jgi:F420-dependent oxidoreductase-like protein
VRQVLAREAPVRGDGPHYPLPFTGPGAVGLGKPLRPITHPLRADLPIWLGAEGPRNVALTAEIADGWLAIYYSPKLADTYREWLDEGFARPGARRKREDFTVAASCQVVVTDDPGPEVDRLKQSLALYLGGMGAPGMNFHADVFGRMGYASVVAEIGTLFRAGQRAEAVAAVPDELVADTAIIGPAAHVRAEVARWERAGVDMLIVGCRDVHQVRALAETLAVGENTF